MFNRHFILALTLTVTLFLSACEQKNTNNSQNITVSKKETILVSVNGETISENDLDAAITRTLGEYASFQLGETGRSKVLQSLVLSKAMAITQKSLMSADEIKDMDRMVSAYREELLTKRYLQQNVVALPVTNSMVENYYHEHPQQFGGKTIKTFEVIKGLTRAEGIARQKMIAVINGLAENKNWKAASARLKNQGLQLEYSKGAVTAGVLKSDIDGILLTLSVNQTSNIHFINELPLIVRILDEKVIAAKPLKAVSTEIKKSLAPVQLKKAVKKVSEQILNEVEVKYLESSIKS